MSVVVGTVVASSILLAAFAVLVGRLLSVSKIRGVDPEWLQNFSTDTYRPMERLLSEDDIIFLRSQPGYDPGIERELRRNRRKVFRAYLRALGQDFNRLHLALRLMVLNAPQDRPDLAASLVRQKAMFFVGLALVHMRLSLHALGVGTVDVSRLVSTLNSMQLELHSLVTAPQAVA